MNNPPKLDEAETPYKWSYVTLVACGSKGFQYPNIRPSPHAKIISFLISHGAPVDMPDIAGLTALSHVAMNNVNGEVIKTLLSSGANPNTQDKYGVTPLLLAIKNNQVEAAEMCLKHGGDLNTEDRNGITPLALTKYSSPQLHYIVQKAINEKEGTNAPLEEKDKCAVCGKDGSKNQCSRCRTVRYCSRQCQGEESTSYLPFFHLSQEVRTFF